MPSQAEQNLGYMIPVVYSPQNFGAPGPGRNIFAFYEPPPPCPGCPPDPTPTPKPIIPTPTPQLPYEIFGVSPQSVYAGSKSFRIEVAGDRFTPDAKIFYNNRELPTTFINSQRLAANVPAEFIANAGQAGIMVRTPDGSKYSLSSFMQIQAPPRPQFQYIGMISRQLGNNDTAYFQEPGKQLPTGYRLNDVVAGRFRLVNISAERVVLEDTNLGFRHPVELTRPTPGSSTVTSPGARPGGFPGFPQNPGAAPVTRGIPGIPDNIPRYTPPNRNTNQRPVDDEDDEDTDNR